LGYCLMIAHIKPLLYERRRSLIISMAIAKTEFEQLRDRLDVLTHILCLLVDHNKIPAISEQIALLASHGLSGAEIGRIVGREPNYVSAVMNQQKKKGKSVAK
jgi:hypothetical protein